MPYLALAVESIVVAPLWQCKLPLLSVAWCPRQHFASLKRDNFFPINFDIFLMMRGVWQWRFYKIMPKSCFSWGAKMEHDIAMNMNKEAGPTEWDDSFFTVEYPTDILSSFHSGLQYVMRGILSWAKALIRMNHMMNLWSVCNTAWVVSLMLWMHKH